MSNTETQRIPACLWESLQEICYRQDVRFISDVSKILGIPAIELKKRILGVRGMPTAVTVERGPWWAETQCPIMDKHAGNMWRRCGSYCESSGYCWAHRHFRVSYTTRRYDDPYFTSLAKRWPVRIDDEIVWVSADGDVLNGSGILIKGMTVDLNTKTVTDLRVSTEDVCE
jgi:hypothetical protein